MAKTTANTNLSKVSTITPKTEAVIVRFNFAPIEDEDPRGADIFVKMVPPQAKEGEHGENGYIATIEDAVSSYIDTIAGYSFEQLVLDVAQTFDPNAEIVEIPTIQV